MYWVFETKQLNAAIQQYAASTAIDDDEQQAVTDLITEFLTSEEAKDCGLLHGEEDRGL